MFDRVQALAMTVLADLPNPGAPQAPPGVGEKANTMLAWVMWIMFAAGILGIAIVAGKMFLSNRRGEGGEAAASLGWVLGGLVLLSGATGIIGWFAT